MTDDYDNPLHYLSRNHHARTAHIAPVDDREWLKAVLPGSLLGFSGPGAQLNAQTLLRVIVPTEHARTWGVCLNAQRYTGTTNFLQSANPAMPADNQALQIAQVTLLWGTGGVTETAVVDYPWGGCTFEIFGSAVTVSLTRANTPGALTANPSMSGFLSPGARDVGGDALLPTFTGPGNLVGGPNIYQIAPSSQITIPMPARAGSYRVIPLDQVSGQTALVVFQGQGSTGGNGTRYDVPNNPYFSTGSSGFANLGAFECDAQSSFVNIINTSSNTTVNFRVVFYLDLG